MSTDTPFSHRRRLVRRLRNGLRQFAGSDWGLIAVLFLFLFVMPFFGD